MEFYKLPTAENQNFYIREITKKHPCSKSFFIGKSVLGRKIPVLTLGKTVGSALFVGATHGSEWLTSLVLLRFFEELCEAFEQGGKLCEKNIGAAILKRGLTVVPVLNPDGVNINILGAGTAFSSGKRIERIAKGDFEHWNANARGVDLNHNFGAGWEILREQERRNGIFGPSPRQYGGPKPFSEPETQALKLFTEKIQPDYTVSYHTKGEEIYWYF